MKCKIVSLRADVSGGREEKSNKISSTKKYMLISFRSACIK
jgi:hypothetical protein